MFLTAGGGSLRAEGKDLGRIGKLELGEIDLVPNLGGDPDGLQE